MEAVEPLSMTEKSLKSAESVPPSEQTPFEVLKTKVYPLINDVMLKVPPRL
jgi:hypothetical protein